MVLCEQCTQIFTGTQIAQARGNAEFVPHLTMKEWKDTYMRCRLCSKLRKQFVNHLGAWFDMFNSDSAINRILYDSGPEDYLADGCLEISFLASNVLALECANWERYRSDRTIYRKFRVVPQSLITPYLGTSASFPESAQSDDVFALIKDWINTCESTHVMCNAARNGRGDFVPSRLLDVGLHTPSRDEIFLVDSHSIPAGTCYVTLSHRWSFDAPLLLTKAKQDSFHNGLSVDSMPRTFRHAVDATRRLGYRYIWIDALCILQDDPHDWSREAEQMSSIYTYSSCNLAATDSATTEELGLVLFTTGSWEDGSRARDRNLMWFTEYGLFEDDSEARDPSLEKIESAWTNVDNDTYFIIDQGFWEFDWFDLPLNTRGWVVQEVALAPRVVHFTQQQVLWQCHQLTACETFPHGLPPADVLGATAQKLRLRGSEAPLRTWMKVVKAYMGCQLTFDDDKLIAISGVARRMAPSLGNEYLAGIWRQDMISQLLWTIELACQTSGHPSIRLHNAAPTWSWASVHGKVSWWHTLSEKRQDVVEILDAAVQPKTTNVFGAVAGGYLRISGFLYRAPRDRDGILLVQIRIGLRGLGGIMDCSILPDVRPEQDHEAVLNASFYLPLRVIPGEEVHGIVLTPSADKASESGTYERWASFRCWHPEIVEYFEATSNRILTGCFYEEDSDHTVRIV